MLLFAAGAAPACLAIAAIYDYWYGSPLSSGYDVGSLFGFENVVVNLRHYPRWLIESQTPIVLLALAVPWLAPRDVLARAGVVLGHTYPLPIVDFQESRRTALAGYENIRR